jgi:hypothetical protein
MSALPVLFDNETDSVMGGINHVSIQMTRVQFAINGMEVASMMEVASIRAALASKHVMLSSLLPHQEVHVVSSATHVT